MSATRRSLLAGLSSLVASPRFLFGAAHARDHLLDAEWLATAGMEGGFAPVVLSAGFDATPVGRGTQRLHWVEPSPDGRTAVAVARRPGTTAVLFDRRAGRVLATFEPGEGRVFSGHGRFVEGGRRFYAVEIERANGQGVVSLREVSDGFSIVSEWTSSGIGPHDMLPAHGGLVVANGGIEPHTPEAVGAEVADAGVAILDPASGETRAVGTLDGDLASLSLRHLARSDDGLVVVAAQDLLNDSIARPLVYAVEADGRLRGFDAPEEEWRAFRTYVGSVATDRSGRYVAAASPRGNRVAVWTREGRFLGGVPLVDGCGLAATHEPGRFLATSGLGEVILIAADEEGVGVVARRSGGPRFDNHAVLVGA
ncbi:DUF1513 domain-containing protein [Ancylobacter oerskovii]|uniref:DUF1513 domain-containing protein n=1 Tax=Ancylobacter oerskovii TaxID=459519 RepID=A0ABW4YZ74_9HYPH|nr:DUF1513 domain-containing protein [Ancylobacter oerskovii]MBS7541612.1 DUF1513 domain-containing protein [Ancylobacter oerskovii]